MNELVRALSSRLNEYQSAEVHQTNKSSQQHVAGIWIAVSLYQLALLSGRPIARTEEYWFDGGVTLAREFDNPQWEDLHGLYPRMVEEVKQKNYFRPA